MFILDFNLILLLIIYIPLVLVTLLICRKTKTYKSLFYMLVELYLIIMTKVVIMPIYILDKKVYKDLIAGIKDFNEYGIQFIPLKGIHDIMEIVCFATIIQLVGNVLLLMPLAFIIVWLMNKTNKAFIALCGLVVSCLIELIQLVINVITAYPCHAVDIDDVILNYFGYLLAVLIIWLIKKYFRSFFDKVRSIFVKEENKNGW